MGVWSEFAEEEALRNINRSKEGGEGGINKLQQSSELKTGTMRGGGSLSFGLP